MRTITRTATALAVTGSSLRHRLRAAEAAAEPGLKGRINHSVCRWCYKQIPFDHLCATATAIGLQSIEILEVKDFPTLKKHGLNCAMVTGVPVGISSGLNRPEHHDPLVQFLHPTIPQ